MLLSFKGWTQSDSSCQKTKQVLLDSVRNFIKNDLNLNIPEDFYQKWDADNNMKRYLYVSRPDRVEKPADVIIPGMDSGHTNPKLDSAIASYREKDYSIFMYETAGNSANRLTRRFLSYQEVAIIFIALHESNHVHLNNEKIKIAYDMEEAAGDVIGITEGKLFVKGKKPEFKDAFERFTKVNESLYKLFNKTISRINKSKNTTGFSKLYLRCQRARDHILRNADQFQKDRFNYPVNNAYLLKNYYYCYNYFLLKELMKKLDYDFMKWKKIVYNLPAESETARLTLQKAIE